MTKTIVDSDMTLYDAIAQNPKLKCPKNILDHLLLIDVEYYSFDGLVHKGQVVVHKDLADDVKGAFKLLFAEKFPIQTVIPIADPNFAWDDSISTEANNTSVYNYRFVRGTQTMSNHSQGRALDINPKLNPYFPGKKVFPPHSSYDPKAPGTILADSKIVSYFDKRGWRWGGNWNEDLDYQHFEKIDS